MSPSTATTSELRDWLAVKAGWTHTTDGIWCSPECKDPNDFAMCVRSGVLPCLNHPIPLDLASLALPEGWTWERSEEEFSESGWRAYHTGRSYVHVPDTGDEIHDRLALKVAVMMAAGDAK